MSPLIGRRIAAPRAAFTLIETVLAASIGAVIVLACLGVFMTLERSDRMLAARAEQEGDLHRLRLVMLRTFTSLVLSDAPRPVVEDENPPEDGRPRTRTTRNPRADPKAPPPPPRIVLGVDPRQVMVMARETDGATEVITPQRLEVVISESPTPVAQRDVFQLARASRVMRERNESRDRASREEEPAAARSDGAPIHATGKSTDKAGTKDRPARERPTPRSGASSGTDSDPNNPLDAADTGDLADDLGAPVKAVRGAFELWPKPRRASAAGSELVSGSAPAAWELWWRPLPPRREADSESVEEVAITPMSEPYQVCSNIKSLRWRMFDDRERKETHSATWTSQLPAYVEMRVETTAGLKADWLFEVDWAIGPEVPKTTPTSPAANSAEGTADGTAAAVGEAVKANLNAKVRKATSGGEKKTNK